MDDYDSDQPMSGGTTPDDDGTAFGYRPTVAVDLGPRFESVLDLDELMSEGRRPERTARFCIRADLVADVEAMDAELDDLDAADRAVGAGESRGGKWEPDDAVASRRDSLSAEREAKRVEMVAAVRTVRVRALPDPEWKALLHKYDKGLRQGDSRPDAFWDELVSRCAITPILTAETVGKLRAQLALSQFDTIRLAAFEVNTDTGVDVPKSRGSWNGQRPQRRSLS